MQNGDAALDALIEESESAITQLAEAPAAKSCQAHPHQARATILLLRWEIARARSAQHQSARLRWLAAVAIGAGVASGLVGSSAPAILSCLRALFA